jgi:hypothetical protein
MSAAVHANVGWRQFVNLLADVPIGRPLCSWAASHAGFAPSGCVPGGETGGRSIDGGGPNCIVSSLVKVCCAKRECYVASFTFLENLFVKVPPLAMNAVSRPFGPFPVPKKNVLNYGRERFISC